MSAPQLTPWGAAARLALVLLPCACSGGAPAASNPVQAAPPAPGTVQAAAPEPDAVLSRLEARAGTPGKLWGVAKYKVKRKAGRRERQLELDVDNAPPSTAQALALDGFDLGQATSNRRGTLQFEISEKGQQLFPSGFREPRAGSVFRVGTLLELRFETLEKLTDLSTPFSGPGALQGKVGFEVERLGEVVTREFQVKVTQAPVKSHHAVSIDGVAVGELVVDLEGSGKLRYSTEEPPDFPPGFPEPHAGAVVRVGELFQGPLTDALAPAGE